MISVRRGTAALAVALAALGFSAVPGAARSGPNLTRGTPTWWQKLQVVSAPGFKPDKPGNGGSAKVGANVDMSNEQGPQSETSIAIDPSDPAQLVGGSNEIVRLPMRGYFSSDGGQSWGAVDLPLPPPIAQNGFDFGSDPGVAWDGRGDVFYSYIVVFFSAGGSINGTEMAVARSADAGHTWTSTYFNLQGPGQFNDKPMIAVDTAANRVYVAWDVTVNGKGAPSSSGILFSRSTDGGVTFSPPQLISQTGGGPHFGIGADPFVGPDGTVYVAWHDVANKILVTSSTDGGQTFGAIHTVAPTSIAFDALIPPQNSRGALVYPSCGADRSGDAFRGRLSCAWMDQGASGDTDIFASASGDGGVTWTVPQRVNDDTDGAFQFNQWLSVDPTSGAVNVSWSDSRNDPTNASTDVFFARSTDGGATFSKNVQVTTAPTNETCCGADLGNQYGDYEGIDSLGGVVHPIWTDRRASIAALGEEVFTTTITTK